MKDKINKYLKKRDWFMPFAPSILNEAKEEYLMDPAEALFMIMDFNVKQDKSHDLTAVLHVDQTVRPQTVAFTAERGSKVWSICQVKYQ